MWHIKSLHALVHKRTLPCSQNATRCMCIAAAIESGAERCSGVGEALRAIIMAAVDTPSLSPVSSTSPRRTNERTNERSQLRSLAIIMFSAASKNAQHRERDRGKKTEKEKKREKERENGHCISVYMSCMCMYKFAARWRMCAHGRGCQRGQSIESRAYLFLYLSFFPFSFFFYFHKYTSQLFDVSQLIFWRKAPKHVDEKWTGLRRKREGFENFVAFHFAIK